MADRWNRFLDFAAAATQARVADVGPGDPPPESPPTLGTLRIGFRGAAAALTEWTALIELPAQGIELGPVDLPCVLAIELPVRVYVRPPPTGAVAATSALVSATPDTPGNQADGATYTLQVPAATIVDVPQWVTTISVLSAGVAVDLLDTAAGVIDQVTGFRIPRPRQCVQVRPVAPTAIVFGYGN